MEHPGLIVLVAVIFVLAVFYLGSMFRHGKRKAEAYRDDDAPSGSYERFGSGVRIPTGEAANPPRVDVSDDDIEVAQEKPARQEFTVHKPYGGKRPTPAPSTSQRSSTTDESAAVFLTNPATQPWQPADTGPADDKPSTGGHSTGHHDGGNTPDQSSAPSHPAPSDPGPSGDGGGSPVSGSDGGGSPPSGGGD